jgi:hypothetical protein
MGIGKQYAFCCQPVYVRGNGLWMSGQTAGPIIQIIERDKQYIGLRFLLGCTAGPQYEDDTEGKQVLDLQESHTKI